MLVSPQVLAATKEPILTAFSVSNKLYALAKKREEYRDVYNALAVEVRILSTGVTFQQGPGEEPLRGPGATSLQ